MGDPRLRALFARVGHVERFDASPLLLIDAAGLHAPTATGPRASPHRLRPAKVTPLAGERAVAELPLTDTETDVSSWALYPATVRPASPRPEPLACPRARDSMANGML